MANKASAVAQEILYSGRHLPQMPENGPELLRMARQPVDTIDVERLTSLIESDPGMATRLLRLANSAYFGTVNKIYGVHQAIMHIGLEETFNTVCYLFYKNALPQFPRLEGFSDREYWSHSWACATAAKMLGHPQLMINHLPGELYIAGLLQGIGKLMLALHRPDAFLESINRSRDTNRPLAETELEVLGTNDGYLASAVLQAWRLPETICMAVRHYHDPGDAETEYREIAAVIQFAYYIANISGVGSVADQYCIDLGSTWISREGSMPLAQPAIRDTHVSRILTDLRKKSKALGEEEKQPQAAAPADKEEGKPEGGKTRNKYVRKRKEGLFARTIAYLKNLFQ